MMSTSKTALERLTDLVSDPTFVSDEQRTAIEAKGNFYLVACPGSGKTRTAGLRAAWLALSRGWKVAATSYTNVAVAEIRKAATSAGVSLGGDHFSGTLHSFLLRFVFYPFGHLVMGCEGQATLVADPGDCPITLDPIWLGDKLPRADAWMFTLRADGGLGVQRPQALHMESEKIIELGKYKAIKLKKELFKEGYASYSDAMFIAMKVLEEHKEVAELVATRFDEIIVDESQDTSDVQLACLKILKQTQRLRSLAFVGDPNQAIYEWQGSDPLACTKFVEKHGMKTLQLTKNFRSSQAICDVTYKLSERPEADQAAGIDSSFGVTPEILLYSEADATGALNAFAARLEELGIPPGDAPMLARGQTFVNTLNQLQNVKAMRAVKVFGAAAARYQRDGSLEPDTLSQVETVIRRLAWGRAVLNELMRVRLRDASTSAVCQLPSLDGDPDLKSWIGAARAVVQTAVASLTDDPVGKASNIMKSKSGDNKQSATKTFEISDGPGTARTIHSVKGESHPAVLLAAARKFGDRDNARDWIRTGIGEAITEETRIGYVALTRAQRYCAVALPAKTPPVVINAYLEAGFVLNDTTL